MKNKVIYYFLGLVSLGLSFYTSFIYETIDDTERNIFVNSMAMMFFNLLFIILTPFINSFQSRNESSKFQNLRINSIQILMLVSIVLNLNYIFFNGNVLSINALFIGLAFVLFSNFMHITQNPKMVTINKMYEGTSIAKKTYKFYGYITLVIGIFSILCAILNVVTDIKVNYLFTIVIYCLPFIHLIILIIYPKILIRFSKENN